MNELTLDGKLYLSSRRAAEITGYAKDYIGQLCREGQVEARLVGRNWYVLESSIKKHRFGSGGEVAETTKETGSNFSSLESWQKPRYETEKLEEIPTLDQKTRLNAMQNAWQEWVSAEPESSQEIIEEEEVHVPISPAEIIENDAAIVPIQKIASYEAETLDLRHQEPEGEIIEERYVRARSQPNLALQSLFVAVALICLAVTAVGTGYGVEYMHLGDYRLSAIDFLSGTEFYSNK